MTKKSALTIPRNCDTPYDICVKGMPGTSGRAARNIEADASSHPPVQNRMYSAPAVEEEQQEQGGDGKRTAAANTPEDGVGGACTVKV